MTCLRVPQGMFPVRSLKQQKLAGGHVYDMWRGRTHTVCVAANIVTPDNAGSKGRVRRGAGAHI
eukprot:1363691-Heterocapsa_arctica.AAC.1